MIFQTVMDGTNDAGFRAIRSSTTITSTVSIAAGTPVILETATASANGGWGRQALTATAVDNNLFVGHAHTRINPDSVGLVQCYGVDTDVIVATAGASVGAVLIPNVATLSVAATIASGFSPNIATAKQIVVLVAPSGAAQAATSVFVQAL
jgi:hypothetical protein